MLYNDHVAPVTFLQIVIGLIPSPRAPQFFQMGIVVKLGMSVEGFIKLVRSRDFTKLVRKDHDAFVLLSIIAFRTIRSHDRFNEIQVGEAKVGDWQEMGFQNRNTYRSALANLRKWGFISFKTSSKGTITTLLDSTVYEINADNLHQQATNKPPTAHQQATTTKNDKKVKNDNKQARFAPPSVPEVYEYMLSKGLDSKTEPQKFIDYYTSNGWKVGKNPMKSWKGAIGGWLTRGIENGSIATTKPTAIPTWKERGFPTQEAFQEAQEKHGQAEADRRLN